jgi:hypothetical protein
MRNTVLPAIVFMLAIAMAGCTKDPLHETEIAGIDLSKRHTVNDFRAQPEAAKQLDEWCEKNVFSSPSTAAIMAAPASADPAAISVIDNCQKAHMAIEYPAKLEGSRPYSTFTSDDLLNHNKRTPESTQK